MPGKMKILAGNSNRPLAEAIAAYLGEPLTGCHVRRFADLEIFVEILENVRGRDAFIIQSTSYPANDNVMELLIMCDALRRASAGSITAVIPYYGYARQDRKVAPRTPITSKLVADLIQTSGVNRVVSVDLHAGQIQGFFNIPFDHLYAMPVFLEDYLRRQFDSTSVFVSPDAGGVERTRARQLHRVGKNRSRRLAGLTHVPLAHAIAVAALGEIDMHVILVIAVGARTQHGHESRADALPQALAKVLGDLWVREPDHPPVGQLQRFFLNAQIFARSHHVPISVFGGRNYLHDLILQSVVGDAQTASRDGNR